MEKRSLFGDPRPLGHAEIVEAMDELNIDVDACYAMVEDEPENDGFDAVGYSAEIFDNESGESFSTRAYPTKVELLKDLEAVGIDNIE